MHDDEYIPVHVYPVYGPYNDEGGKPYWKVIAKLAHKKSGTLVKRTTRASSEQEAGALRQTVVALLQQGFQPIAKTATVGDLLNLWRQYEERKKPLTPNREETLRKMERNLLQFLPAARDMSLQRAAGRIKSAYEAWSVSEPIKSPRTLQKSRAMLIRFFRVAKTKKWIDGNPMEAIEPVTERAPKPERRRLTIDEALQLWAHCRSLVQGRSRRPRWPLAVQVALLLGAGLRVGEIMDAQVRGLDRGRGGQILRLFYGKTDNAARIVPLHQCPWLLAAVTELAAGRDPLDPLFPKYGSPDLTPERIKSALVQAEGNHSQAARVLGVARRSFSGLLKQGVRTEAIKYGSQVGHGLRSICRKVGVTVLGCHGLRRTNTDLRDVVADRQAREMRRELARRQLGHAAGSRIMETAYLSPELQRDQEMADVANVFAFLDSGGVEAKEVAPPGAAKLQALVDRLGVEQAAALLEAVSGSFPAADLVDHQRRRQ